MGDATIVNELDLAKSVAATVERLTQLEYLSWDDHEKIILVIGAEVHSFPITFAVYVFQYCHLPTEGILTHCRKLISSRELEYVNGGVNMRIPKGNWVALRKELASVLGAEPEPELRNVSQALRDLVDSVPAGPRKVLITEALLCCRAEALHSAIVMSWNFAIDHFVEWLVCDQQRMDEFNIEWQKEWLSKNAGLKNDAVDGRDGFRDLKESAILRVARKAGLLQKEELDVLEPALKRRNDAAHPDSVRNFKAVNVASHISELVDFVLAHTLARNGGSGTT